MEDPETLWGMKRPVDTGKCSARTLLACFTVFYLSLSSSLSLLERERKRNFFVYLEAGVDGGVILRRASGELLLF